MKPLKQVGLCPQGQLCGQRGATQDDLLTMQRFGNERKMNFDYSLGRVHEGGLECWHYSWWE